MEEGVRLVRWAGRVPRHKIQRLYESDASGLVDEELIDEVAYGFYARCQSILQVTAAHEGRVRCPRCGQTIAHHWDKGVILVCGQCAWETTWEAYLKTYQGKHLHGGSAMDVWSGYLERFPAAQTVREKMLLIDWLIHQCHQSARPVAVNLIGGQLWEVMNLLEELAYGQGSAPGAEGRREAWREAVRKGGYAGWLPEREGRDRAEDEI